MGVLFGWLVYLGIPFMLGVGLWLFLKWSDDR
jgi:hypothetical protein